MLLKVYNLENSIKNDLDEERLEILTKKKGTIFKNLNDYSYFIVYEAKKKSDVETYFGITINENKEEELIDWISECMDNDSWFSISKESSSWQIGKNECIDKLRNKIDKYEKRISNAINVEEEIEKIIKEQMNNVLADYIADALDKINNGNFEWGR
jgi:hypothetical protein